MAQVTYIDTAHSGTTPATVIDAQAGSDDDRVIKKIIVGKPTAAASLILYKINNAFTGATTNIAFKYTYPTFGAGTPATDVFDFTSPVGNGGSQTQVNGLVVNGGSVTTSSAMQVSVLWDLTEA